MDRVGKANTSFSVAAAGSVKHLAPTQPVRGWLGTVFATPHRHWILSHLLLFPSFVLKDALAENRYYGAPGTGSPVFLLSSFF